MSLSRSLSQPFFSEIYDDFLHISLFNLSQNKKLCVLFFFTTEGPLHIPALPATKRSGYEDASLLRQPWGYPDPAFDYNSYSTAYAPYMDRDRKVFYPSYPHDAQYAQVRLQISV